MEPLLVISDEPALAETLASELHGFTVTGVRASDAEKFLYNSVFSLIVIDGDTHYPVHDGIRNAVKLNRPIRLREAIYTIKQQLKSRTVPEKEEIRLAGGHLFSVQDKTICSDDGTTRVTLTDKEAELLRYIGRNHQEILSRSELLKNVWGYGNDINTHTLETHIYRLRSKLKQLDENLDIVFSEEGGYRLK